MSLTSFLLGASKKQSLDKDLDAVFKTQVSCVLGPSHTARNDLLQALEEPSSTAGPSNEKKRKSKNRGEEPKGKRSKSSGIEAAELKSDDIKTRQSRLKKTVGTAGPKPENLDIETSKAGSSKLASKDLSDSDGGDSDGPSNLVHETLRANEPKAGGKRQKCVPSDETQAQKDARTIFIGNLPPEVAQTRVSGALP